MNNTYDVIVVGAGAAELTCAQKINQAGLKVIAVLTQS